MNAQGFKKGVLELVVLESVREEGYVWVRAGGRGIQGHRCE